MQLPRVGHCVAGLVVVEEAEYLPPVRAPFDDPLRPLLQALLVVASLIGAGGAVQADVDEVGGHLQRRPVPSQFEDAEGGAVAPEQLQHLLVDPARVAKFEGVAMLGIQDLQQGFQAFGIASPAGRELEQDGAQPVAETGNASEKSGDTLLRILELLHVGDVAAGLGCEQKTRWHRIAPPFHRMFPGKVVERAVDFDAAEVTAVVFEQCPLGQIRGVEGAPPVGVGPAGGADMDGSGHPRTVKRGCSASSFSMMPVYSSSDMGSMAAPTKP